MKKKEDKLHILVNKKEHVGFYKVEKSLMTQVILSHSFKETNNSPKPDKMCDRKTTESLQLHI